MADPVKPDAADYVPALRFRWLTRFYDRVLAATLPEQTLKRELTVAALNGLQPGSRVLDMGCGTGTLTIMLKQAAPEVEVFGLDGDPEVLRLAQRKALAAGVQLDLQHGLSYEPPFPAASFDRVVSSLVFHHLTTDAKRQTLQKLRELLRPGGELHILDWGEAQNALMRFAFLGVQLLDGFKTTTDNVKGRLVPFMLDAGFTDVTETRRRASMFGTLSLYKATAPGPASPSTVRHSESE